VAVVSGGQAKTRDGTKVRGTSEGEGVVLAFAGGSGTVRVGVVLAVAGGSGTVRVGRGALPSTVGVAVVRFGATVVLVARFVLAGVVLVGAAAGLCRTVVGVAGFAGIGNVAVILGPTFCAASGETFKARSPRRSRITTKPAAAAARTIATAIIHQRLFLRRLTTVSGKAAGTTARVS
jgi:hypothetical protein